VVRRSGGSGGRMRGWLVVATRACQAGVSRAMVQGTSGAALASSASQSRHQATPAETTSARWRRRPSWSWSRSTRPPRAAPPRPHTPAAATPLAAPPAPPPTPAPAAPRDDRLPQSARPQRSLPLPSHPPRRFTRTLQKMWIRMRLAGEGPWGSRAAEDVGAADESYAQRPHGRPSGVRSNAADGRSRGPLCPRCAARCRARGAGP
jgi:hypothetical protein